MKTIAVTHNTSSYQAGANISLLSRFVTWSSSQQANRLLWLGIILSFHGCILTPLTVMAVLLAGNNFTLFMIAFAAMGMSLVTNLAAMPTKITIPVFAASIILDLIVAGIAISHGFNIANTF